MLTTGPLPSTAAAASRLIAHINSTSGSVCVVTGPVGSGKSYLLDVLEARALERGRRVLRLDADEAPSPELAARALLDGARLADQGARAVVLVDRAERWNLAPCLVALSISQALRGPAVVVASRRRPTMTALLKTAATPHPLLEALAPLPSAEAQALLAMHGVGEALVPRLLAVCGGNPLLLVQVAMAIASRCSSRSVSEAIGEALLALAVRWSPADADPADTLLLGALALVGDAPAEILADAVGREGESVRRTLRKYAVVDDTVRGLHLDEAPRRVYRAELGRHAPRALASLAGRLRGYVVERLLEEAEVDRWVALLLRLEESDLAPAEAADALGPDEQTWSGTLVDTAAREGNAAAGFRRRIDWLDASGGLVGGLETLEPVDDPGSWPAWATELAGEARAGLQPGAAAGVRLVRAVVGGAATGAPPGLAFRLAADLLRLVKEDAADDQVVVLVGRPPDDPAGAALRRLLGPATAVGTREPARGARTSSAWHLPPGGAVELLRRTGPPSRERLLASAEALPDGNPALAGLAAPSPSAPTLPAQGAGTASHLLAHSVDFEQILRARLLRLANDAGLSVREREVLDLLLLGRSAADIGLALNITARTAKFHQANVLAKLGADSRHDLMRLLL